MTPSQLKTKLQEIGSHFFDRKTMKFFGDTMKNYGCRTEMVKGVECWELYRKRPVKYGINNSSYFDKQTLKRICPYN